MRYLAFLLLPALVQAFDCQNPANTVEKAICAHPDLQALNQQLQQQASTVKTKLTGENAAIFADTEMPFVVQLNDCSNQEQIPGCIQKVLTERRDLLTRAESDPDAIRQAIAQVHYIDIGFLWKYWPRLVDRKVSVYGCLMPDDNQKTHAMLETENQAAVPLLFKSMTDEIADFLDDQKPCSHWLVTVRKQGDKFILYADDVLGRPLP
jgi:uncharacterized protein